MKEALNLEMNFEEASERPQYMRGVLRDWIEILGPMAKKLKGYPAGDPTDLGGAKLAALHRFPDLKPEDEAFFLRPLVQTGMT